MQSRRFRKDSLRLLFFSRGRGRGHAIPDAAIISSLRRTVPDLDVLFVSYATGARVLRSLGYEVIDLGFGENSQMFPTLIKSTRIISHLQPSLVISHEEFSVPVAARIVGVRNIFLTDWFPSDSPSLMQSIAYSDTIICLDHVESIDLPDGFKTKAVFTGPVLKKFSISSTDRQDTRNELGLNESSLLISVIPGGASNSLECNSPIWSLVTKAFRSIPCNDKKLVWIADEDFDLLSSYSISDDRIEILRPRNDIERLMIASDVVITKGNRITTMEAAALGVQTVSLSHGLNPVDDRRIHRIPHHRSLNAREISHENVAAVFRSLVNHSPGSRSSDPTSQNGLDQAVQFLVDQCDLVRSVTVRSREGIRRMEL